MHSWISAASSSASRSYTGGKTCILGFAWRTAWSSGAPKRAGSDSDAWHEAAVLQNLKPPIAMKHQVKHQPVLHSKILMMFIASFAASLLIRDCKFLLVRHDLEAPTIQECKFLLVKHALETPLEAPKIRECKFLFVRHPQYMTLKHYLKHHLKHLQSKSACFCCDTTGCVTHNWSWTPFFLGNASCASPVHVYCPLIQPGDCFLADGGSLGK